MKLFIRLTQACASVLLVTLLAACGGGGGDISQTAAQCYSLTNGNEFLTATTTTPASLTLTSTTTFYFEQSVDHTAIQATTFNGAPVQSVISTGTRTYSSPNARQEVKDRSESFFTTTGDKFNLVGFRNTTAAGDISDTIVKDYSFSLNLAVGAAETLTFSAKLPSSTTTTVVSYLVKLLAIEDVVTPAGTFKNACKFSVRSVVSGGAASSAGTDTVTDSTTWLAPGWGSVKEVYPTTFRYEGIPIVTTATTVVTSILRGAL
jgi:hypothetical protein